MTLPRAKGNKITRLPQLINTVNPRLNAVVCEGCWEINWGKDNDPATEAWRGGHHKGFLCGKDKPKLTVAPEYAITKTETEMIHLMRDGQKYVLQCLNPKSKRNRQYRWYRRA
jgi:hypothetical protein